MIAEQSAEASDKLMIDLGQAADQLGVSERLLRSMVARGEVPHVRCGRRVLFPVAGLTRWVEERTVWPGATK